MNSSPCTMSWQMVALAVTPAPKHHHKPPSTSSRRLAGELAPSPPLHHAPHSISHRTSTPAEACTHACTAHCHAAPPSHCHCRRLITISAFINYCAEVFILSAKQLWACGRSLFGFVALPAVLWLYCVCDPNVRRTVESTFAIDAAVSTWCLVATAVHLHRSAWTL